jgi:hypothetical protein
MKPETIITKLQQQLAATEHTLRALLVAKGALHTRLDDVEAAHGILVAGLETIRYRFTSPSCDHENLCAGCVADAVLDEVTTRAHHQRQAHQ